MQILLGISGGIAAYKTPELVRQLRQRGHTVRCVLTAAAARLVSAEALAAVSQQPVATTAWVTDGTMPHIDLPRWCDVFIIAPATADVLARCALGLADDLLTTAYLAIDPNRKLIFAPAMNTQMWNKPIVQSHIAALKATGATIIDPVPGNLACGEQGVGAMVDPSMIVTAVDAIAGINR
jgi:phosphopantothenoylcysteine decarboxylase / phosphopantothenate---cysteine ligase